MNIKIKVVPESYKVEDGFPFCIGKITIGDFWETFILALDYWTIKDYQKQWEQGLEGIKKHGYSKSCLIASIQDYRKAPLLNWWVFYREGNKIFIQNQLFAGTTYEKVLGENVVDHDSWIIFIPPRRTVTPNGHKISEWVVDFE